MAKFIDLDTGLPAMLNKVKAWVNSKTEDFITAEDAAGIVAATGDLVIVENDSYIDILITESQVNITPASLALYAAQKSAVIKVSGTHLKNDISISVPTGFTASPSTISHVDGTVAQTDVTIAYTLGDATTASGNITATAGDVVKSIPVAYSQFAGPTILADSTLTIKAAAGQSNTGSLQVTGMNLTAGINASVIGTGFTVSSSESGTYGNQASLPSSGGTLYVKFSPTGSAASTGTLTLSSTGATSKTVTLTGAVATLTVSPSSLSFSTDQGVAVTDSFTIQGTNLTNGVSLSITGTNAAMFTLSKNSLTKAEAEAGEKITVTYTPTGSGNHSGNVGISWEGADKAVSLNGSAAAAAALDSNGRFQKGGICYGATSDGNGGWTDNVKVYNTQYKTNGKDTSNGKYSGVLNIPSTVTALKNGMETTFTVIGVDDYAFRENTAITSITIPDTVTGGFPSNMLYGCTGLTYFNTGNGVTALGYYFASACSALEEVVCGDSLTTLNANAAWQNLSALRKVTIGSSVSEIGSVFGISHATQVTTIICKGTTTIPVVNRSTSFTIENAANITVYIPDGTRADYIDKVDNKSAVISGITDGKLWKYFDDNNRLIEQ